MALLAKKVLQVLCNLSPEASVRQFRVLMTVGWIDIKKPIGDTT